MQPKEFRIEHAGKTHTGTFTVSSGLITVISAYGTKTTQVGSTPPETLAGMLLRELIQTEAMGGKVIR